MGAVAEHLNVALDEFDVYMDAVNRQVTSPFVAFVDHWTGVFR